MQPAPIQAQPLITAATTDPELAQRATQGDESAFEAIMRRHNRLLFRTARGILKIDADAEDALQEAYLCAWAKLATFRAEAKLSTWLVRIVINEALTRLRRHGAMVIPLDTATDASPAQTEEALEDNPDRQPERTAMRSEIRRLMEARIDMLPEAYRTVFMLRAVEEMSVDEVAAALEISEASVRTRFFRARGLLREGLSREVDVAVGDAFAFAGQRCDRIVARVRAQLARGQRQPR